jgi:hypothetical protein
MEKPPTPPKSPEETARRLLDLEAEREVSGTATSDAAALAEARAALHAWVDSVAAVVAVPGAGRVSLIHADGGTSQIISADMAYKLSPKVRFDRQG